MINDFKELLHEIFQLYKNEKQEIIQLSVIKCQLSHDFDVQLEFC